MILRRLGGGDEAYFTNDPEADNAQAGVTSHARAPPQVVRLSDYATGYAANKNSAFIGSAFP
jgi:hypothetical protein